MGRFALVLALIGGPALAEEWVELTGPQIEQALTGRKLDYGKGVWQDFRATGRTLYHSGRPSWGYWAVRGDKYCSSWPPSDLWACYGIQHKGDTVRFVGEEGDITDGTYSN